MWINQQYLKNFTPINQNVDISEVSNHIESAEIIYVRELLGKLLYDDLSLKIIQSELLIPISATLSSVESELVFIVKQMEAYRTCEIAIPFLGIKIRNKGVQRLNDEFATPASIEELKYLRNELSNRAEYFLTRAKEYLCDYSSHFPLFNKSRVGDVKQNPYPNMGSGFDSDIYIDNNIDSVNLRRNRYWFGDSSI